MYLIIWMRVWHCCNAEMKSHNVFFVWIFCILNYVLLFIGSVQNVLFEIHFCVYLWLWEIRLIKGVHQCAVFLIKFMYSCIQIEKQELKIWSWSWHDNTLKKMKSNKSILHSIWKSIWIRWISVHQSHIKLQTNSYFMFGCVMLVKERKYFIVSLLSSFCRRLKKRCTQQQHKWHHILECQLQLPHNLKQYSEWRSGRKSIRNIHYLQMIIIQVPSDHIYKLSGFTWHIVA